MERYRCTVCGHIYTPAEGDPKSGIAPRTIDYEVLPTTSEAFIYAAMGRFMIRRLA